MSAGQSRAGFLEDYIGYAALTRTLQCWASEHSEFVRLSSIGKSEHGRDVWMLEIGTDPDRLRPAICIDGNMHSAELLGSNVALAIVQSLIDLHRGVPAVRDRFASPMLDAVVHGLYYIIPRVSPDGAEEVLTAGRLSRSAPRRRERRGAPPHWVRSDVDGDGCIRQMRLKHPAGELVQHPDRPHVLVPRTIQDEGPFFKVFPEGHIESFDGLGVPFPHTLSDNDTDFNRNFPFDWSRELDGAGHFPGSEPETRALIEFATRSPHIFAWLNLHTFGGIFIRPPFSETGQQVEPADLLVYEHTAALIARETGMPTVSAFDDMTPVASRPMTGTLAAWAYGERGCLAWAVELWDLFAAAGLDKRRPYYRNYAIQERDEIAALVDWDQRENSGRTFAPWRPFVHSQLGAVELGGVDPVRGLLNPPEKEIAPVAQGLSTVAIALASFAPRVEAHISSEPIAQSLTKIRLVATNRGYLPTFITAVSRAQPWNGGLQVRFRHSGCNLVSGQAAADIGHLPGWGRGADEESNAPFFQKSQGIHDVAMTWVVEGAGQVEIEIGAPRTGWSVHKLNIVR
jgi:hypothetical protein